MTSKWLLHMSIEVLYLPQKFIPPKQIYGYAPALNSMGLYHDGHKVYHDTATAMKTWTNGVLLRNRQIHGEFTVIGTLPYRLSQKHVCGRHGHWGCHGLWMSVLLPCQYFGEVITVGALCATCGAAGWDIDRTATQKTSNLRVNFGELEGGLNQKSNLTFCGHPNGLSPWHKPPKSIQKTWLRFLKWHVKKQKTLPKCHFALKQLDIVTY